MILSCDDHGYETYSGFANHEYITIDRPITHFEDIRKAKEEIKESILKQHGRSVEVAIINFQLLHVEKS